MMSSADYIGARELEDIADRWRQLSRDRGAEHAALGLEFNPLPAAQPRGARTSGRQANQRSSTN